MVISIVSRYTAITNQEQAQARLQAALPRIKEVLQRQPGFVSVQYLWGLDGDGSMGNITTWQTLEDCRGYLRGGAAALVTTIEDSALPTAAHPRGTWQRKTYTAVAE